jgi:hypothetical protein
MLLKSRSYRSKPRIEIYCGECIGSGRIAEIMVVVERSNDMRARTYQCRGCGKSITLVVTQEMVED